MGLRSQGRYFSLLGVLFHCQLVGSSTPSIWGLESLCVPVRRGRFCAKRTPHLVLEDPQRREDALTSRSKAALTGANSESSLPLPSSPRFFHRRSHSPRSFVALSHKANFWFVSCSRFRRVCSSPIWLSFSSHSFFAASSSSFLFSSIFFFLFLSMVWQIFLQNGGHVYVWSLVHDA